MKYIKEVHVVVGGHRFRNHRYMCIRLDYLMYCFLFFILRYYFVFMFTNTRTVVNFRCSLDNLFDNRSTATF